VSSASHDGTLPMNARKVPEKYSTAIWLTEHSYGIQTSKEVEFATIMQLKQKKV